MPTIVVEDGTGTNAAANWYWALADVVAYHVARGTTAVLQAGIGDQQAAGFRAMDWLDRRRWLGTRKLATQPLQWPRVGLTDDLGNALTGVPLRVKQAFAEALAWALAGDLPGDALQDQGGAIAAISAGPVSITYHPGGYVSPASSKIDGLLRGLAVGSLQVPVVRA